MIAIIVDNHCHQVLENGMLVSAPIKYLDAGGVKVAGPFVETDPADMDLYEPEAEGIRQRLKEIADHYASGRHPVIERKNPDQKEPVLGTDVRI